MGKNYWEAHICQCLTRLATGRRRNSPITITDNRSKTGQQFVDGVLELSSGLIELGLKPGDIVAISALNSDLYLEWLLAVAFIGGITAPLNYRWSLDEARSAMDVVRPILLVTDTGYISWHALFQAGSVSSLKWHVFMNSCIYSITGNVSTTELIKKPSLRPQLFNYSSAPEGTAIICFTSGTTGRPKGVTLSHSALIVQSLAKIAVVGYSENDVYLHTAPLCHIGGISSAMAMLMVGGCHVLIPRFEAKLALEAIKLHHVTSLITVPAIMSDIITFIRNGVKENALLTVKKILNGGGSLSVELLKDATKVFPRAKLLSAYGMTEACSSLTFMTLYDPTMEHIEQDSKLIGDRGFVNQPEGICVGKPAPHVELRISIEDSSYAGRIMTRGPHLMLRYWGQNPTMEASSSGDDGWLDTGDIGRLDDQGNLWLIGRTKGRIKSGGENVYPEEVEFVLSKHPGISCAVVIGLPDTRLTEMVVACVQIKNKWKWAEFYAGNSAKENALCLSSEILRKFCRENNLTGFKIPKTFIIWRKPFPLTTSGKLQRDQLRTQVMAHMQLVSSSL